MVPIGLVDISRLFFANLSLNGGMRKFDYRVLRDIISPEEGPVHAFTTFDERNENQGRFVSLLENIGYSVHTEPVSRVLPIKGKFQPEEMKDLVRFDAQIAMILGQLLATNDQFVVCSDSVPLIPILDMVGKMGKQVRHLWLHEQLDTRWDNLFSTNGNIIPDDLADYRKDLLGLHTGYSR